MPKMGPMESKRKLYFRSLGIWSFATFKLKEFRALLIDLIGVSAAIYKR